MATPESPSLARPARARRGGRPVLAVVAAAVTGATSALDLADPGPLVRWGLPLVSAVSTLAASATVGAAGPGRLPRTRAHPHRAPHHGHADGGPAASVWAVAALLEVVLTFADLAGTPLTSPDLVGQPGVLHLDPGDHPGPAHQRPRRRRRGGLGDARDAAGRHGLARRAHPRRRRHPRPHGARRRVREPRGRRQRARPCTSSGSSSGPAGCSPSSSCAGPSARTSAPPSRATPPSPRGASPRSPSPASSRPGSGSGRSERWPRHTAPWSR